MKQGNFYTAPGLIQIKKPTLAELIADKFGVPKEVLQTPFTATKKREIVNPRFCYMHVISKVIRTGPYKTGQHVGRGHADVIHACKEFSNRVDTEKDYRKKALEIIKQVRDEMVILPEICKS